MNNETPLSEIQLPDGLPSQCCRCHKSLCVRQQTMNLAMNYFHNMRCLICLAEEMQQSQADVLSHLYSYIERRQCFAKEWRRYSQETDCPDPSGCIPSHCFKL